MHMTLTIRNERPEDIDAITRITEAAFQHEEHSSHTEQFIVNALRRAGQLSISLVAVENDTVAGTASARSPCARPASSKASARR